MGGSRDHYDTLGVAQAETDDGIRRAFRRRAKACHPDCAGPERVEEFKELAEAYDVLSDPESRARYDAGLRSRRSPEGEPWSPGFGRAPEWPTEPMAPGRPPVWPRREEPAELEVRLSAGEARRGGSLPISLPEEVLCPSCGGLAPLLGLRCVTCRGFGYLLAERRFELRIPPGTPSGALLRVRLGDAAGPLLRVRIVVA